MPHCKTPRSALNAGNVRQLTVCPTGRSSLGLKLLRVLGYRSRSDSSWAWPLSGCYKLSIILNTPMDARATCLVYRISKSSHSERWLGVRSWTARASCSRRNGNFYQSSLTLVRYQQRDTGTHASPQRPPFTINIAHCLPLTQHLDRLRVSELAHQAASMTTPDFASPPTSNTPNGSSSYAALCCRSQYNTESLSTVSSPHSSSRRRPGPTTEPFFHEFECPQPQPVHAKR